MTRVSHANNTHVSHEGRKERISVHCSGKQSIGGSARARARSRSQHKPESTHPSARSSLSSVCSLPYGTTAPSANHPSSSIFRAAGRKRNETDFGPDGGISASYSSFRHAHSSSSVGLSISAAIPRKCRCFA